MGNPTNTITIDREDYFRLVELSERRRQAIFEAFQTVEQIKSLKFKIDFTKKPKTIIDKMQFKTNILREIGSLFSDEEKQQAFANALGKFTNKEYLDELKKLSQDE